MGLSKKLAGLIFAGMLFPTVAFGAEGASAAELTAGLNSLWVLVGAVLVIFMQAGFALLEAGSARMKNAGHIAGKTVLSFGVAVIAFWALGFGFAFGNGNSFFGTTGFFVNGTAEQAAASFESLAGDIPISILFLFHLAFAGVSLAIAGGGFAERAKLSVYVIFGFLFTIIIYPVVAHWVWGGGWLGDLGKQDFAGSTVVHLTGATAALVATLMLKPRLGRFNKDRTPNAILGHNQVFTVLGVLIIWLGWFGFNPASTLSALDDGFFGFVAFNTALSAAGGALAAMLISWLVLGKGDITSLLNGVLAALVAITASCAFVEAWAAVLIGGIAGIVGFLCSQWLEKMGIDDPIYAVSVHGVAGIWGTLSTGFFATPELAAANGGEAGLFYGGGLQQLGVQTIGVVGTIIFVAVLSFIILYAIKVTTGLRVTEEEETVGLDLSEHGTYGYPEQMKQANDRGAAL